MIKDGYNIQNITGLIMRISLTVVFPLCKSSRTIVDLKVIDEWIMTTPHLSILSLNENGILNHNPIYITYTFLKFFYLF